MDQFHFLPSSQINLTLNQQRDNLISDFLYPRSSFSRRERSSLLNDRPFSIRFELYEMEHNDQQPALIGVWKSPVHFDYLPVYRLAKVLHLRKNSTNPDPCLFHPCPLNDHCRQCYCSHGSLCQANSRLTPFCVCPLNRFGDRCSIENDRCHSNPCENKGICFPDSEPDQVVCLCTKEYAGLRCETKRVSIHLSLSADVEHRAVVFQFFEIDLKSLDLILLQQQVFRTVPDRIEYLHYDDFHITGIVVAKLYSSYEDPSRAPDLHLLSVHLSAISVDGTTKISSINRCPHLRTFSNGDLSPIRHHQICIDDPTRLCFRDDVYLCICEENHTRVECFPYNDELDQCNHCLAGGRCLQCR